ncbi:MAG TPA: hypothetical protein VKR58_14935, partial [Aquella sp.]|nr:hypothetical protein [Aquella sp.]
YSNKIEHSCPGLFIDLISNNNYLEDKLKIYYNLNALVIAPISPSCNKGQHYIYDKKLEVFKRIQKSRYRSEYGIDWNFDVAILNHLLSNNRDLTLYRTLYSDGFLLANNEITNCIINKQWTDLEKCKFLLISAILKSGKLDVYKWTRINIYKYEYNINMERDLSLVWILLRHYSYLIPDDIVNVFIDDNFILGNPSVLEYICNNELTSIKYNKVELFEMCMYLGNLDLLKMIGTNSSINQYKLDLQILYNKYEDTLSIEMKKYLKTLGLNVELETTSEYIGVDDFIEDFVDDYDIYTNDDLEHDEDLNNDLED